MAVGPVRCDYCPMGGLYEVLRLITLVAFAGLAFFAFRLWRQRHDRPSFWMFVTFLDLAVVAIGVRAIDTFAPDGSAAVDFVRTVFVAVLLLFPYLLYRVAHAFASGGRLAHAAAAIPTAVVVVWSLLLPRIPGPDETRPGWYVAFVYAVLFQWVLCSVLVAVRFWRAGNGQPPVTRKRMRTLSLASTALSVAIVISGTAGGPDRIGVGIAIQLFALISVIAFSFAFAPPAWLRASWRRESEERLRRGVVDLMGAVTDQAVVEVLLPHAAQLIGAEGIAMLDPDGRLIGSYGGAELEWSSIPIDDEAVLEEECLQKLDFPFGCLLVKSSPYTIFFGRDEVELLGALGVMTNLALERVRASEMRLELAEAQIRRQQALQINDNVVQGLAVAKYAFDLGDNDKAKEAIEGTLSAARKIISDLLEEVSTDEVFGTDALTRDAAATGFVKKDL